MQTRRQLYTNSSSQIENNENHNNIDEDNQINNLAHHSFNILAPSQVVSIPSLTYKNIIAFEEYIRTSGMTVANFPHSKFLSPTTEFIIGRTFLQRKYLSEEDAQNWKSKPYLDWLIPNLKIHFPEQNIPATTSVHDHIKTLSKYFAKQNINNVLTAHNVVEKLQEVEKLPAVTAFTEAEHLRAVEKIYEVMADDKLKKIKSHKSNDHKDVTINELTAIRMKELVKAANPAPKTISQFINTYLDLFCEEHEMKNRSKAYDLPQSNTVSNNNQNHHSNNDGINNRKNHHTRNIHKRNTDHSQTINNNTTNSSRPNPCEGCGRNHTQPCALTNHPDYNHESVPWLNSTKGKAWSTRIDQYTGKNHQILPWKLTLDGNGWNHPPIPSKKRTKDSASNNNHHHQQNQKRRKNHNSKSIFNYPYIDSSFENTHYINNINNANITNITSFTTPCFIEQISEVEAKNNLQANNEMPFHALIDTGALNDNYISNKCFSKVMQSDVDNNINVSKENKKLCTAMGQCITQCVNKVKLLIKFVNYNLTLHCLFSVIDSPFDIIIGRPTIMEHNLLPIFFPCAYSSQPPINKHNTQIENSSSTKADRQAVAQHVPVEYLASIYRENQSANVYHRASMREFIDIDECEDEDFFLAEDDPYALDPFIPSNNTNEQTDNIPQNIVGSPELQQRIRDLCLEFQEIFSMKVKPFPADIPPFQIQCDITAWNTNKNKLPPRVQTSSKQKETIRQINEMLTLNVIRTSTATSYSQVLLVPKPNNKWRFCVDYRNLNKCCTATSWPIPNIQLMIARIGSVTPTPKYFAKIDFTSGYHQAPLSQSSCSLTAFITIIGIFEWLRVPMGPKGSASYFQQVICSIVLIGLIYSICEVYIDDILIYAHNEDAYIERLRLVFERFVKHKITINPEKSFFGLTEVEFVGHIINSNGITFSRERIEKVLQIEPPIFQKQLKQFLGVVNYFHSHIRDHSVIVHPLHQLVSPYGPNLKIKWTSETINAFDKIKQSINNCPLLSFLDEHAPVFLHTDASDYGIGAYLFQLKDKVEYPIAFISKALNDREKKWSTPEKECYSIYYSLIKLEYLLRDIHFTIRTDHRNLTYLNNSANAKVNRWKMCIQNFNFDIEYLEGRKNIVADGLSRLMENTQKEFNNQNDDIYETDYINSLIDSNIRIPNDKYNKISSVHNSIAGHHGVEQTLQKLIKSNNTWNQMRKDVRHFIRKCPCCQKMSVLKIPIHSHPFTTAGYNPMERLNIDSIGPLEADDHGNCHIIVAIDCFTRFVELYPVPDTSAYPAAIALLHHVGRYGVPSSILSDNGSQYVNDIINELLKLINTEHSKTMAYSKEENAIVERANKEVIRHLRAIIFDKNISHIWSLSLPFIQRIINSSYESSIGTTPASLLFGNSINLDRGIIFPFPSIDQNNKFIAISNWSASLINAQNQSILAAQKHQLNKDIKHISNYKPERTEFEIGSYVLMAYPSSSIKSGPPSKLNTHLKGPLKVINFHGNKYILENLVTKRTETVHVSQLRLFYFDPERVDPFDIAIKDQFATVVESIINHTPIQNNYNKQKVSEMKFLVRWKDLTEEFDRILPWKELRNNPVLHKYLAVNNMYRLIPNEHKSEYYKNLKPNEIS
jgi:hypothetical protein